MICNSLKPFMLTGMLVAVYPIVAIAQTAHKSHGHQHAMAGQMPSAPKQGPHGGTLKQSGLLQFGTIVSQGGIQMFALVARRRLQRNHRSNWRSLPSKELMHRS